MSDNIRVFVGNSDPLGQTGRLGRGLLVNYAVGLAQSG